MNHNHQYMQENIVFRGNLCKGFFQSSFLEEAVPGEARLRAALPILCVGSRAIPTGRGQQDNRTTGQFTACQINTQQHKKNKVILEMTTCAHPVK